MTRAPWEAPDRWALAGAWIGGRRCRLRRRRGLIRAIRRGARGTSPEGWRPWKTESDVYAVYDADAEVASPDVGVTSVGYCSSEEVTHVGGSYARAGWGRSLGAATDVCFGSASVSRVNHGVGRARTRPSCRVITVAILLAAFLTCRVGEASNPGPPGAGCATGPRIKLVGAPWKRAVAYPPPHRDGFRDIATPGFSSQQRDGDRRRQEEDFRLIVETVNSTGRGPLRRRLLHTDAHVVMAQETWVLPDQLAKASSWARRKGWQSLWAPAAVGPGGGASGGVAILARAELGLRHPIVGSHVLEEARAVAGFVDPPGHRPILLACAYLRDGKGMSISNKATLARIGECAAAQGAGCLPLVAGDFQCGPQEVADSGFPEQIQGKVMAAQSARGTYRTKAVASTLDFFVAAHGLAEVIEEVTLVEQTGIKGHVPVQAAFAPRPVALKALAVRRPPDLELERVYGPLPPPRIWDGARRRAIAALRAAAHGAPGPDVQQAIDDAYERWCHVAEAEIADVTGSAPCKWGLRGQMPKLKWASVLPESSPKGAPSAAVAATYLRGFVNELTRIMGLVDAEAGSGYYVDPFPAGLNRPHGATFATPVRGGYGNDIGVAAAGARGGRPRPPTDLSVCV